MNITNIVICALALLSSSSAFAAPYLSAQGYQIEPPAGWETVASADGKQVSFRSHSADSDSASVIVAVVALSASAGSGDILKASIADTIKSLKARCVNVTVKARGKTELGGRAAAFIAVEYQRGKDDGPYKMAQVCAVNGSSLYSVTIASSADQYSAVHDRFNAVLAGFTFVSTGPAKAPDVAMPAETPDVATPAEPVIPNIIIHVGGKSFQSDRGYSLTAPDGWIIRPHLGRADVALVEQGATVFAANLLVKIKPNPNNLSANTLLSEHIDLVKAYAGQAEFKIIDQGLTTVGGKPAVYSVITMRNDQAGGTLRLRDVETPLSDGIYEFTSIEKDAERVKYDPIIASIVDSVQWTATH